VEQQTPYRDDDDAREDDHRYHSQKQSSQLSSSASRGGEDDGGVAALADTVKEGVTSAAKSLFSFAASSLSKLADVAIVASSGSASGAPVQMQIGNTKVTIAKELAEGAFGTVYLVHEVETHERFAMKKLICQSKEQIAEAHNELSALQRFAGHENIVSLIDHCSTSSKQHSQGTRIVMFLFPLYPRGTAWDAIEQGVSGDWPFSETRALLVLIGAARGLAWMHEKGFAHRDIKPHNILLANDDTPVLMDFGSVTAARKEITTRKQALDAEEEAASKTSAAYRAPELTTTPHPICIDERVDVWALGCTLFCLAFGRSPFETAREGISRLAILNGRYQVPAGNRMRDCTFSQAFIDLIASMLDLDHNQRPFANEVVEQCSSLLTEL